MKTGEIAAAAAACCLFLVASPLLAAGPSIEAVSATTVQQIIHLGTLDMATGTITSSVESIEAVGDVIWDNTAPVGSFRNTPQPQEILDTGDLPAGTNVGAIQIGFATDASGSITLQYGFYENDNFDTRGAAMQTLGGTDAIFPITINGLPGGGVFGYTLDVALASDQQFVIDGPDLDTDGDTDWGWGFSIVDPGNATALGPLIAGEGPFLAPGRQDNFDRFDAGVYFGTFFFGGAPFAQFHMQLIEGSGPPLIAIPTVSTLGAILLGLLLASFSVAILARRRRSA